MHTQSFFHYLEYEKRSSAHTLAAYRSDLEQFIAFLERSFDGPPLAEIDHQHIRAWIVALMDEGLVARSVNRKLSTLKTYFRFLRKHNHLQGDPMRKVQAPKTGKRLPTTVRPERLALLLNELDFPDTFAGTRDKLILEILYGTGMRRSELAQLPVAAIDFDRREIRVLGKRNKERLIPVAPALLALIGGYLPEREAQLADPAIAELILTNSGKAMYPQQLYTIVKRELSRITTAEQRSPHVLRHSFATHLSDGGADINAIKELLGHAGLAATQIYTHNSIEKLREVYAQAHPKAKEAPPE